MDTPLVLSGQGLACADKAYRPFLLSPTPSGSTELNTYEMDGSQGGIRYLCLKLKDPETGEGRYYCGQGMLAEGRSAVGSCAAELSAETAPAVSAGGSSAEGPMRAVASAIPKSPIKPAPCFFAKRLRDVFPRTVPARREGIPLLGRPRRPTRP